MSTPHNTALTRRRRRRTWAAAATAGALVAVGLAWTEPEMRPIHRGTPSHFWAAACGVDLDGLPTLSRRTPPRDVSDHVLRLGDGWVYYEIPHIHGSELYRIREEEVTATFEPIPEFMRHAAASNALRVAFRVGLERWSKRPPQEADAWRMIRDIREAVADHYREKLPDLHASFRWDEWSLEARVHRLDWYWATIVFEWLFLTGWLLWLVWPWVRGQGRARWAVHLGLAPLLFMLPVYLGYARLSFTSAGPCGGVLYPLLFEHLARGSCNDLDKTILRHLPPLLEPLSAPIGSPMSLSGRGLPGPTTAVRVGVIVVLLVIVFPYMVRRFAGRSDESAPAVVRENGR